jgi:hypothetical protein
MLKVKYTKVSETDPGVQALAKASGREPKQVAAMVNQMRYRQAYNKMKQERDKAMRRFFKEHPEMLTGEGEPKGGE